MVVWYDITKAEKYLLCILWTTTTFLIRSSTLVVPRVWSFLCVVNKSETETNGNGRVWAVGQSPISQRVSLKGISTSGRANQLQVVGNQLQLCFRRCMYCTPTVKELHRKTLYTFLSFTFSSKNGLKL